MTMLDVNVTMTATGVAGPPRSVEESEADQAAGLAMIAAKHARLDALAAGFEAEGHAPAKAKVLAAMAYNREA